LYVNPTGAEPFAIAIRNARLLRPRTQSSKAMKNTHAVGTIKAAIDVHDADDASENSAGPQAEHEVMPAKSQFSSLKFSKP
jgi:hypothetical protein